MRAGWKALILAAAITFCGAAYADNITVAGSITQSTADGTGPAANNPSLNGIADGDAYTLTLNFTGALSAPGTYDLTGGSLVFSDPTAPAGETGFDSISLTVSPDGANDDLSLFACLSTGSGCLFGDSLSLNFAIPPADLNLAGVPAGTIFGLSPALDLLEDDGVTDIQGNVAAYSYSPPRTVTNAPEPGTMVLLGLGLAALAFAHARRRKEVLQ